MIGRARDDLLPPLHGIEGPEGFGEERLDLVLAHLLFDEVEEGLPVAKHSLRRALEGRSAVSQRARRPLGLDDASILDRVTSLLGYRFVEPGHTVVRFYASAAMVQHRRITSTKSPGRTRGYG